MKAKYLMYHFTYVLAQKKHMVFTMAQQKCAAPWYNSYTHSLKKETRILERKWRKSNLEVFRIAWKNSMSSYRQALKTARTEYIHKLIDNHKTIQGFYLAQWLD